MDHWQDGVSFETRLFRVWRYASLMALMGASALGSLLAIWHIEGLVPNLVAGAVGFALFLVWVSASQPIPDPKSDKARRTQQRAREIWSLCAGVAMLCALALGAAMIYRGLGHLSGWLFTT